MAKHAPWYRGKLPPLQDQIMSSNRNATPDPNADTPENDVSQQVGDDASRRKSNAHDTTLSTDTPPLTTEASTNPVIINK